MLFPFKNKSAEDIEIKYEFYFLALTFTILGLSLQSAKFENYTIILAKCEIFGWILLLLCGLFGLAKMNIWHNVLNNFTSFEEVLKKTIECKDDFDKCKYCQNQQCNYYGKAVIIMNDYNRWKDEYETKSLTLYKIYFWLYILQYSFFVIGIISIITARATSAISIASPVAHI
jgi:hypothetical protein